MNSDVESAVLGGRCRSIYNLYSPLRSNLIKFTAAMGFLLSYSGSIYLPAFKSVASDLNIGQELVAATVGVYLVANGLSFLIWGPASDRWGRAPVYAAACVMYIASCLGCMFSPNITALLVFRGLQGGIVAAFSANAWGVLADIVPPLARGQATGINMIAVAVGVVVSPLVGGALAGAFGWRATFAGLAIFCVLLALMLVFFVRHETHQYFVLQKLAKTDRTAAEHILEWESVMAKPPKLDAPWIPLKYMCEPAMLPHALVFLSMWTVWITLMMEVLPHALAHHPYNLPAELIGVSLLVDALPTLVASPLGGYLSDKAAAATPGLPVARLAHNTLVLLLLMPTSCVGLAWALQYHAHLAIILIAAGILCFAGCFYAPAMFSYITTVKQSAPSAATCGLLCVINLITGFIITAGALIRNVLGFGWWLTCLAVVQFVVTLGVYILILRQQRAYKAAALNMPPVAELRVDDPDVILPMEAGHGQHSSHVAIERADKDCGVPP